ncbi:related to Serine/threonine-protein kinase CBK1 [Sporisorium reilianum f. sp. reilianum]|uniref:Related to Serine/threonine-protein kinase CBK1 n=1 Tax=Sporisorium reilianum f. sp. reilianum TaxID=72559 RepID=A0A2N8UH99_9BASI|nr:related to Serine/threonine-protein kinase CBK1 [Sporisorium reilianum f. sp. reilianum]
MTLDSPSWQQRHDTIRDVLQSKPVRAAARDFQISHSSLRSNDSDTSKSDDAISPLSLGKLLDISLVITWSAHGLSPSRDPNPFRAAAGPSLQHLRQASLQAHDFKTIKVLQKSAGSLVEVVKNRLDGRVYVLKSLVKGFARRNAAIQTPINETRLLQRNSNDGRAPQLLTPQLLAAFQTQNSVHVLMEYVPSGDFSELLMAASSCGAEYPGRAATGLLTQDWILRYSVDMIQAIAWVHAQGFAHRDIKPGNFLLDTSGHLKLCDFSSAAPFSDFNNADHSSRSSRVRRPSSTTERKVWAFYCSQPTGTCDYLSPEVLEAEEHKALERQKQLDMSSLDDMLGLKRSNGLPSSNDAGTGPQEVAGMYGPEVDWWSFGVMLYEMRFGVLPFFASKMEETYEKIKDHTTSLTFDPSVACSPHLKGLIQGLLTAARHRLGRRSSEEVQHHAFYRSESIDWSMQWPLQPPFTPNANIVDLQSSHAGAMASNDVQQGGPMNGIAARLQNNSFSVVSSLPSFSALYTGDPDDFPAFADSRELESDSIRQQHNWWEGEASPAGDVDDRTAQDLSQAPATETAAAADDVPCGMPRSSSSPAVVLNSSSQSITLRDNSSYMAGANSPHVSCSAPRWSDCDVSFIGFSYLPHRDAFANCADHEVPSPGEMSTAASLEDLAHRSEASPNGWPAGTPVASTPFHRGSGSSSHSITMLPTPPSFAPSPVGPVETAQNATANPVRPSAVPFSHQQSFVTPARKPSYMAMHERLRQLQGQEAPIPEDALESLTPAVPPSPYPFPVASVARTSKFTGGKKPLLYRRDLDRARSATPGGGSVGSDSRQSGGSNAVREMSEREAWDEMMAAVQKSVRKKQPIAPVPATPLTSSAARPAGLTRSTTDPQLSVSKPATTQQPSSRRTQLQARREVPVSRAASARRALQSLNAPRQPTEPSEPTGQQTRGEKSALATQPSGTLGQRRSRANLIAPRATFKVIPPESSPRSSPPPLGFLNESPRFGAMTQNQHALDIDMYDSDASDDSSNGRRNLRHKKSARQLLIRAQERGTPTKPKRAQSPPLTDAFASAPSVAAVLEAACVRSSSPILLSEHSARSCHSSRDVSYERGVDFGPASHRVRSGSMQISGKESPDLSNEALSSSLGKTSVTFAPMAYVPVLGAIPPWRDRRDGAGSSDGHGDGLGPARETSRTAKTIRRKDSGEMLSQYRKTKGMGRATSMLSLSDRAKADAEVAPSASRPGTALSSSSPANRDGEDDFILGHVESRMRLMAPGGSLPGRTIRRFSSVLSLKEREKVTIERPASQDGTAKTSRGFGRFKSRLTSSTLSEEPTEELAAEDKPDPLGSTEAKGSSVATNGRLRHASSRLGGRKMGDTLPKSFALRGSSALHASTGVSARQKPLGTTLEAGAEVDSPAKADVSLMTGLNHRHTALQGSLLGLEQRLARLKARLED